MVQSILDAAEESLVMVEEDTITGLLAKKMVKVSKKIVEVQNKYVHLHKDFEICRKVRLLNDYSH